MIINSITAADIVVNKSSLGIKTARISTGAIPAVTVVDVTVTWSTAFPNTNYTVSVAVVEPGAGDTIRVLKIVSVLAGSVTFRVNNPTTAPITGTLHVVAIAD